MRFLLLVADHQGVCDWCHEPFTTRKPNKRFCSREHNLEWHNHHEHTGRGKMRRFPRIQGSARRAVFERDQWTCRICGAPIDPALRFPHPGFASVDHIDPFGAHDPSNWQAAHLACNIEKGRRARIGGVKHAHLVAS